MGRGRCVRGGRLDACEVECAGARVKCGARVKWDTDGPVDADADAWGGVVRWGA